MRTRRLTPRHSLPLAPSWPSCTPPRASFATQGTPVPLPSYSGAHVTDAEFATLMAHVGVAHTQRTALVVGVSGGADSLALAVLADRWAQRNGSRVIACVIDHDIPVRLPAP